MQMKNEGEGQGREEEGLNTGETRLEDLDRESLYQI